MKTAFVVALLTCMTLTACNQAPREPDLSDENVILDRLHLVTNARVGMAYVDPNADFSRFSKVMLDPLDLSKTEIVQPGKTTSVVGRREWQLTDEDIAQIQKAFLDAFTSELEETGDYQVVSEPGPDVLRIAAAVNKIAPSAAKDDARSRASGRSRVYTEGAGSMTITFAMGDSETGEALALVTDSRGGSPYWGVNNAVTNMSDVRFMFRRWARMLRARLDIAHGY
jgi:hypothetical protein